MSVSCAPLAELEAFELDLGIAASHRIGEGHVPYDAAP
jgi:hypothetical protein